jgi:uncharacterized protein
MNGQVVGFQWDDGNWPKCGKHGVSLNEIEAVLAGEPAVFLDKGSDASEQRFNAVGRTPSGRYVFVAFTLRTADGAQVIRPISARYMHAREVKRYERQGPR